MDRLILSKESIVGSWYVTIIYNTIVSPQRTISGNELPQATSSSSRSLLPAW